METVFEYIFNRHYEDTLKGDDECTVDNTVLYKGSVSDREYLKVKKTAQQEFNMNMARKEYEQKKGSDLR